MGIDSGVDEDLLREEFLEFTFLALEVREGLDLGVKMGCMGANPNPSRMDSSTGGGPEL